MTFHLLLQLIIGTLLLSIQDVQAQHVADLFSSDQKLRLTLTGKMQKVLSNKSGKPNYFPLTLSYAEGGAQPVTLAIEARTRGNFRRSMGVCKYPPLMLRFTESDSLEKSIFKGQNEIKLVMPCKGEKYVIREYLIYKLYNLITPRSFKARLVEVTLDNKQRKKYRSPFYGILLEDEDRMAERNGMISKKYRLKPLQIQRNHFLIMAVFQYLIGNTDWSVEYMQNINLIAEEDNSLPFAVPYDFDHAGMVSAPYARPTGALKLKNVRERRYRGYCVKDLEVFIPILQQFEELKPQIYQIYEENQLLDEKSKEFSVEYLNSFYRAIGDSNVWKEDFSYPCDPKGTGRVVIKGLKGN